MGNETAHAGESACSRPALQLDRQQRSNFFGEASTLNTILSILPAMFSVCHCPVLQMPLQACPSKPWASGLFYLGCPLAYLISWSHFFFWMPPGGLFRGIGHGSRVPNEVVYHCTHTVWHCSWHLLFFPFYFCIVDKHQILLLVLELRMRTFHHTRIHSCSIIRENIKKIFGLLAHANCVV